MKMNPFLNPVFLSKVVKSYLFDIDRLKNFSEESLKDYQDKCFKKMVEIAFETPMYRDKYKDAGLQPKDISGIEDITKLPFVDKDDFKKYYPSGIISPNSNKNQLIKITTSGTTGKSLSIYEDMFGVVLWFFSMIRSIKHYGISWRKHRISLIADFNPHTIENKFIYDGLLANFNRNLFFSNIQWLNTNDNPKDLVKEIDKFKPDLIAGYVGMLCHLALLKEKGHGKNINPRWIATTGGVLTKPLKKLLEETFNSVVFDSYGATESGIMAFLGKCGHFHVNSDLVYLEFFMNGKPVGSKEQGKLILTKLYGSGTPIIRYSSVNDIVAPLYEKCKCGIPGQLIDRIYGRDDLSLFLTDGRVLLPSTVAEIHGRLLYELKTNKVQHTRITQHSLNHIEIKLVFDNKLKEKKPSAKEIFSVLSEGYHEKIGPDIKIDIKEVNKVSDKGPRIVTKVDKTKFKIKKYI
jgi:phenylacetate-CoA ligase